MMRRARVLRLATAGPHDTAPLAAVIKAGEVDPATIVAIVGKTEGNGCVNDFTRGYATLALKLLLAESLKCTPSEIDQRVAIVMSGGTEGGLSPHLLVFCREPVSAAASGKRLAIGIGLTRAFAPEEIGRKPQIRATAEAVAAAMEDAGITSPADVHFVQIKCPMLTKERIEEAARRGASVATDDTYHSMALSRGASAPRRRFGAGRGGGRDRGCDLPRLVALFERRQHLGRRRAFTQRDRGPGQRLRLGRRPGDRPRRHEDAIDADTTRRVPGPSRR
jgi:cyanuric acid amidohydrolase